MAVISSTGSYSPSPSATAADTAEQDAQSRITRAEERVKQAERDAHKKIDQIRDDYVKQAERERVRDENALETQKERGYESLRNQKLALQADLRRDRRDGDQDVAQLQTHYRDAIHSTETRNRKSLSDLQSKNHSAIEYEKRVAQDELDRSRADHALQMQELRDHDDSSEHALAASSRKQYQKMRETYKEANEKAHDQFHKKFESEVKENHQVIADVDNRASQQIGKIRRDTSRKLSAYAMRQRDPFYKMLDVNAKFRDAGDAYVVTLAVPPHEHDHVSAVVEGNQLVISGARHNQEKLNLGPGRYKSSSSYQTFQESFPLLWPVEDHKLSKSFDGDEMTIRVPKKDRLAFREPQPKVKPEAVEIEQPHFPDNLPVIEAGRDEKTLIKD